MTAEAIAKALGGRKAGGGWTARCPAHDDRTPSLSIRGAANHGLLVQIIEAAIQPYFDSSLSDRVATAKSDWEAEAQEALDEQIDSDALDVIRERAAEKLEEIRTEVERINDQLRMAVDGIVELPEAIVPEPEVDDEKLCRQAPLISSSWSWVGATRALIVRKAYGGAG